MKSLSKHITESLNESFYRLPKDIIGNDVHQVKGTFKSFVSKVENGDNINVNQLVEIIKALTKIADSAKEFKKKEDIKGTVYESLNEDKIFDYRINCASKATSLDVIDTLKEKLLINVTANDKHMIEFESEKSKSDVESLLGELLNKIKLTSY